MPKLLSSQSRTTLSYRTLEKEGLIINQYEINTTNRNINKKSNE